MSGWITALLLAGAVALVMPRPRGSLPSSTVVRVRCSAGARREGGGRWLSGVDLGGRRRRRQMRTDMAAVLEVCDLLTAELEVGRPPGVALTTAARQWPPLVGVVEAFHLGADVPSALRALARDRPGAADLRLVAGAWQVAHHSGHGLATALARTSRGIRSRWRTRRLVDSELASARATARLVALLPVVVLLMGTGAGSQPWIFLLTTPFGLACLVSGLSLIGLGLWWIERLADAAASR